MIPWCFCDAIIGHVWSREGDLVDADGLWHWRECTLCRRVEVRHAEGKRRGYAFQRPWAQVLARGGRG